MAAASSALAALRADGRPQSTKDPRRWKGNRVGLAHVITGPLPAAVNAAQRGVVRTLRRLVDARSCNRYDRDRLVRPAEGARRQPPATVDPAHPPIASTPRRCAGSPRACLADPEPPSVP